MKRIEADPILAALKQRRIERDAKRYPLDPIGYAERVRELEAEGMTRSDAQGVADVELGDTRPRMGGGGLIRSKTP